MNDERAARDESSNGQETRRLIDFRILQLERDRDDHENRLRTMEFAVQELKAIRADVTVIRLDQKEAGAAAWRNFWTILISVTVVIATIIAEHFAK